MDYTSLLALFAYFAAVQCVTKYNMKATFAAFIAVGIPYLVGVVTKWIYAVGYNLSVLDYVFSVASIVELALQLVVALIVFRKIYEEDELTKSVGWAIGGFLIIVLALPIATSRLFV